MVESSRSITAAVITAPNATHRHFARPDPPAPAAVSRSRAEVVLSRTWVAVSAADDIGSSRGLAGPLTYQTGTKSSVPTLTERNGLFQSLLHSFFMTETNARPGSRPGRHGPMSGRQAEAARNDQRILDSARAVFVADPGAPITAVAKHAGVGISALYTRYGSKEELLRRLCTDGLLIFVTETEKALGRIRAGEGRWPVFADYMRNLTDADTNSLTRAF